MQWPNRIRQ